MIAGIIESLTGRWPLLGELPGVLRTLPRASAAVAVTLGVVAIVWPALLLPAVATIWLALSAVVVCVVSVVAVRAGQLLWAVPLPAIVAVVVTASATGTPIGRGAELALVGGVALLLAAHLLMLDVVATGSGVRGLRPALLPGSVAVVLTALLLMVSRLPPLHWLWLVGVGLAAAAAGYALVTRQTQ
jgi:hypothetical protein